jgi:hypothetical protein
MRSPGLAAALVTVLGAGCSVNLTFLLVGGTIAPGYSDVFSITDGCVPYRDNFCDSDRSVRIERATSDTPSVATVAIESGSEIRVTAIAPGRAKVRVHFIDDQGGAQDVSAVYVVAPADQVTFQPVCDATYHRVGSEPYTYAGDRDIHILASGYAQGDPVYGEGYQPWNASPLAYVGYFAYGQSTFHTPSVAATRVVTSPVDPALSVPFAFFPSSDLTLALLHQGNRVSGGLVTIDLLAQVKGGDTPLCVDPFFRLATIETPDTCRFSPDPVSARATFPGFHAYGKTPTGTCRVRFELEGTTVSATIEVPVDAPAG